MNKTVKKIAVTFVTALLIFGVSVNSFAVEHTFDSDYDYWNSNYFVPSPDYPTAESLPYGKDDTLIYEVLQKVSLSGYDGWKFHRFYLKKDLYNGSGVSAFNGATTCFVYNNNNKYEAFVSSPSTVYYQNYIYFPSLNGHTNVYSFGEVTPAPYYKTKDGMTYNFYVLSGDLASNENEYAKYFKSVYANAPCYYGGRDLINLVKTGLISNAPSDELPAYTDVWCSTRTIKSYPTSSDFQIIENQKNNEQVVARLDDVKASVIEGFSSVNQAITNAVDDILNAGSDMPTLDTNNDWMNDSLTKVNEWVSSLDSFKQQMNEAKEENASNMQQAKIFINGFFDVLPKGIIAILTLGLVMIVVVKVIGR